MASGKIPTAIQHRTAKAAARAKAERACRRLAAGSSAPTAWPTKTAEAAAKPRGIMNTIEATLTTTAQAATVVAPTQPAKMLMPEKAPTSTKFDAPAPSPIWICSNAFSGSARGGWKRPMARAPGRENIQASNRASIAVRAARVAKPAPTAPNAGRPKLPGTSRRSRPKLTILASHMEIVPAMGLPCPSIKLDAATNIKVGVMEAENNSSGARAPSTKLALMPVWRRKNAPPATRSKVEATPNSRA